MRTSCFIVLFLFTLTSLFAQTVQQRLDFGESPCEIFYSGIILDSLYGKTYQGGLIFYVDTEDTIPGIGGLVAAPSDQGNLTWGCEGTLIGGTSPDVGSGQANTTAILAGCTTPGIAADIADMFTLGGYSDWFLPSLEEGQLMYTNLAAKGFGSFSPDWYWTSTEFNADFARRVSLSSGAPNVADKDGNRSTRVVRAFSCPPPPAMVPTMSQWGLFLFGLIVFTVAFVAVYNIRRKGVFEGV